MKKFKLISLLMAALSLPACDFLEEVPETQLVQENVYQDEVTAYSALLGCYKTLFNLSHSSVIFGVHGASILRAYGKGPLLSWYKHTLYSMNSHNLNAYSKIFGAIAKINTFIDGIEASDLPEDLVRPYVAEARFLRAFYYFTAVRFWGDVPYFLHQPVTVEEASIPRTPYQEVYRLILQDLDFAEANMQDFEGIGIVGRQDARACNYAATALKAKVWLQMACLMETPEDQWFDTAKEGRYPDFSACGVARDDVPAAYRKALSCAEDVIQKGPYSLEPDYANLFRFARMEHPEDYLSPERILVIPITPQLTSCTYSSWSLPKQLWGTMDYTTDNGNKTSILPSRFTWETWCAKYGAPADYVEKEQAQIGVYHYYSGCADPRLDVSYAHTTYYTGGATAVTPSTQHCYPYCVSDKSNGNLVALAPDGNVTSANAAAALFPFYKKGISPTYAGAGTGGDADIYLMRYADVLLTAAEAAAGLCASPSDANGQKAIGYVNQLLLRARRSTNRNAKYPHQYDGSSEAAAPQDWEAASYPDKDALLLAITWEKVFEMDYEFQSFFETRKRGATWYVNHFVKPYNAFMHEAANIRFHDSTFNKGLDKEEDIKTVRAGLLLAFPDQELRYNTALGFGAQNDFFIE